MDSFTEDAPVEQPSIALFEQFGWEISHCREETFGPDGDLGREASGEVVLLARLCPTLERLNPDLPLVALNMAVKELLRVRILTSPAQANLEVHDLIKDGGRVTFRDEQGIETVETVHVIDWENSTTNDFLLTSQLWISGELHTRRTDLLGFVNGLPLVLIELKAAHKRLENAYKDNSWDYKDTILPRPASAKPFYFNRR